MEFPDDKPIRVELSVRYSAPVWTFLCGATFGLAAGVAFGDAILTWIKGLL